MAVPTRRDLLKASGIVLAAAPARGVTKHAITGDALRDSVAADLDRYIGFGIKASGGTGDNGSGAWIESECTVAGFATERQSFAVPWFDADIADLTCGATTAPVLAQAMVVPTPAPGVSGRLVRMDPIASVTAPMTGAIALVDLPVSRWSSALAKPIRDTVNSAFAGGAVAAVIVTNGPTGDAIALNAPADKPLFPGPVAILAPRDAKPFLIAAPQGDTATLRLHGKGGERPAFNLIGRIDRGKDRWIVVSTPRSGWFTCGGERGSGIAVWLALARWAAATAKSHNLAFVCNSGHEYEYLGSEKSIGHLVPAPDKTDFWFHLGANVATRDWHEPGGGTLLPLPSADPQRFLVVTPALIDKACAAFNGLAGLEMAYPSGQGSAGELTNILAAGYARVGGIFGAHRFHHSARDDSRCVDADLIRPVISACQCLIRDI